MAMPNASIEELRGKAPRDIFGSFFEKLFFN
jgi:hypothetical protein